MKPLLLPLVLLVSAPAWAAGDAIGCNPEGTQLELNACAADELSTADAELNATWRQVLTRVDQEPARERLKVAQRLWIQSRDADLDAAFPLVPGQDPRVEYGSMYPMSFAYAKAALTRQRTAWLRTTFLQDR